MAARKRLGAVASPKGADTLLYEGSDWDYDKIQRIYEAIEKVALTELGLDVYPNQIEVITSEQMLDAYSSVGMPLMYNHWTFGKHFARDEALYRKGMRGLAYEIVINSSPCISYIMEENSMTMQALVIAHAAFGHNHFFKNNQLFRQWTDAESILTYLDFAKRFIAQCEDRYGADEVEKLLDAAHALQSHGIHRYPRKRTPDLATEERREAERRAYDEKVYNDLWRTLPTRKMGPAVATDTSRRRQLLGLPEENLLYFLEKKAPKLKPWQREIIRIVRHIAQYFYPQRQTKVMNEGCATFIHHRIMTELHQRGQINDAAYLEFLHSHTNVVMQPEFDDRRYSGINPYALGYAMMEDIVRIAETPTAEDREWFPDFAGRGDGLGVVREAWRDYRDESFIQQFLSPALIRKFKLFHIEDNYKHRNMVVRHIQNERGYRSVRRMLAQQYDIGMQMEDIQVRDVDLEGDRKLILQHTVVDGNWLDEKTTRQVLQHLANLWKYPVRLVEVDQESDETVHVYDDISPVD